MCVPAVNELNYFVSLCQYDQILKSLDSEKSNDEWIMVDHDHDNDNDDSEEGNLKL